MDNEFKSECLRYFFQELPGLKKIPHIILRKYIESFFQIFFENRLFELGLIKDKKQVFHIKNILELAKIKKIDTQNLIAGCLTESGISPGVKRLIGDMSAEQINELSAQGLVDWVKIHNNLGLKILHSNSTSDLDEYMQEYEMFAEDKLQLSAKEIREIIKPGIQELMFKTEKELADPEEVERMLSQAANEGIMDRAFEARNPNFAEPTYKRKK